MKKLKFDYSFVITYESDVSLCSYTIKGIPQNTARQKIEDYEITMIPEAKPEWGEDSHGNKYIWGCNKVPHKLFKYEITGTAVCGLEDYEEIVLPKERMIYRHPAGLNRPGKEITGYFEKLCREEALSEEMSDLEKARVLMERLSEDFEYEKESTDIFTTAEEAFSLGRGVCQDYAHILIALLQLAGCSARYVTGFLIGEGATHAWVEVASGGKWYGLDPTNRISVTDSHIRLGVGRDASECQINRGIIHGMGKQKLEAFLSVTDVGFGSDYLKRGF